MSSTTAKEFSRRGLRAPFLVGVGIAAVGAYFVAYRRLPGFAPACPIHVLSGYWCPGCGGTRAMSALADGDLPAALGFNALIVALVVGGLGTWLYWLLSRLSWLPPKSLPNSLGWWLLGAIVLFTVVRNLPGLSGALGP